MVEPIINGNVKWKVFIWAFGVVLVLFGITFTAITAGDSGLSDKVKDAEKGTQKNTDDMVDVKVFIGSTNEILKNINTNIEEIKEDLKNK